MKPSYSNVILNSLRPYKSIPNPNQVVAVETPSLNVILNSLRPYKLYKSQSQIQLGGCSGGIKKLQWADSPGFHLMEIMMLGSFWKLLWQQYMAMILMMIIVMITIVMVMIYNCDRLEQGSVWGRGLCGTRSALSVISTKFQCCLSVTLSLPGSLYTILWCMHFK